MSTTVLRPILRSHLPPPLRPTFSPIQSPICPNCNPSTRTTTKRNATVIRRPHRPTTFQQIVILSDGSSYVQITTSPKGIVRCTKDIRNHILWNPSSESLASVEEDEAGRLRKFREKFGTGFDAERKEAIERDDIVKLKELKRNWEMGGIPRWKVAKEELKERAYMDKTKRLEEGESGIKLVKIDENKVMLDQMEVDLNVEVKRKGEQAPKIEPAKPAEASAEIQQHDIPPIEQPATPPLSEAKTEDEPEETVVQLPKSRQTAATDNLFSLISGSYVRPKLTEFGRRAKRERKNERGAGKKPPENGE